MHSIAPVKSASGAGKYFANDDFVSGEYYADEEAGDVSVWGGEGARDVGLTGAVSREAFTRILNGELPSGAKVDAREGRRPGFDLTFSAPKSVSFMAYVAGDTRILGPRGAQAVAVQKTMAWVERSLAAGRVTTAGKTISVRTGSLVYALFQHDTSRALDPQAHIHAVVANLTKRSDGKWQALDGRPLWRNNTVIGSIYHAFLRAELDKLGYRTELYGKHGTFEIAGVPRALVEAFSQRREQIRLKAEQLGIVTPKGRDGVALNTRDRKLDVEDRDKLVQDWRDKAAALGFDGKELLATAQRARDAREASGAVARRYNAIVEAVRGARTFVSGLLWSADPLVDRTIAKIACSPEGARAQLAVASAVRILNQREAAFDINRLAKQALDLGLPGVAVDHVQARIQRLVAQRHLLPGHIWAEGAMVAAVTTPETLATEQRILSRIERGNGKARPVIALADAPARLQAASSHQLNPGQLAAATMIVAGNDRSVVIQGVAGAGKSTMLEAVARLTEAAGMRVLGLAFQNKMVADMKVGAGIEAQTIASFLWHHEEHLAAPDTAAAQASREKLTGTMIVVDETSMVSSHDLLRLLTIADALRVEKVVMVGDRQQLSSIDAGKAFAVAQAGGAPMARMDENIRQRTDTLRTVATLANVGRASEALRVLGASVVENERPAEHAANLWLALSARDRDVTAVFASGRETRRTINTSIQAGLVAEGSLSHENTIDVTIHHGVGKTREEMRYADTYRPGQSLHVRQQVPELGLTRGTYAVTRVFANGKVELDRGGHRYRMDPQKIDPLMTSDRLELSTRETIKLHEGDRIRWTANDKGRGMHNAATARIVAIDERAITVELASKDQVTLDRSDPMLSRLDLAYSLNMHMAQGVTTDKAITVMLSHERNLSNQRLFNVGVTRVRDALTVVVDSQTRLERQLNRNPGHKTSALESLGRLHVDGDGKRGLATAVDGTWTSPKAEQDRGGGERGVVAFARDGGEPSQAGFAEAAHWRGDGPGHRIRERQSPVRDHASRERSGREDPLGITLLDNDDLRGVSPGPANDLHSRRPEKNLSLDL